MKKLCALLLVLVVLCVSPALADEYLRVINCNYAPIYASYEPDDYTVLGYVPCGEEVYLIATVDRGYFVVYGNLAGYIDEGYTMPSMGYEFVLPGGWYGEDWSGGWDDSWGDMSYVNRFWFEPIDAVANQKLATRSGPGTEYTGMATYPASTDIQVYYLATGSGTTWVYFEFSYRGEMYRLYTGFKRVDVDRMVPESEEQGEPVTITADVYPHFGPGYEYAKSDKCIPANTEVEGFYVENGWVMFDYELDSGKILRAWAPPEKWVD